MNKICFGIDIGGTTVKCGLFSEEGELLEKSEIPTRKENGGNLILDDIKKHMDEILSTNHKSWDDVIGIGMGVPGSVRDNGVVNKCVNLGWGVFNVAEEMMKKVDVPVRVGNDANMAALGEYFKGGGKGNSSMVMVTIGTGVGAGIIINGTPLNGFNGAAAEIGHMPLVEDETETCNCGKKGCLEQVASATGIARMARRMLAEYKNEEQNALSVQTPQSSLAEIENITAKDVFDEAKKGDELANRVVEYICRYLAKGLACAAGMVDPECFLIGGGVSAAGTFFTDRIEKYYRQLVFHPSKETKILLAQLGNDAGMYGAAKLALNS